MPDLEKQRLRSRLEAAILDGSAPGTHRAHGERKSAVIGAMSGTVVEIGPGTGVNMRYYAPGTHVIAIEPNPSMHARLRANADRHGVELEIRTLRGESIDVDDDRADGVVGTFVLCGVDDPALVISEVHRVLMPGRTYFFVEHVGATPGSLLRRVQLVVRRPHRWTFNGCDVTRDTASTLRAAGFADVTIDELDQGPRALHVRTQIAGTATKAIDGRTEPGRKRRRTDA